MQAGKQAEHNATESSVKMRHTVNGMDPRLMVPSLSTISKTDSYRLGSHMPECYHTQINDKHFFRIVHFKYFYIYFPIFELINESVIYSI